MNKLINRMLSAVLPGLVANMAYKHMTRPLTRKLLKSELEVLEKAEKEKIPFKEFEIQTYKWQGKREKIMLVHGWEGQAANFRDLIHKLIGAHYTVYAFDAPSHGFSSKGKTNPFEFTELVGILIRKFGVAKLVSHSFGGVATTFALFNNLDLKIEKYVLLTTPDKLIDKIENVVKEGGISGKVKNKLVKRLEKETSLEIERLGVSEFVKTINVDKALIIHDKKDTVIPIGCARNVYKNWKGCQFLEIEGTGHFKILRTKLVLDKTLEFLNN